MGFLKAPKAPDPYQTAAAQANLNKQTAVTSQQLNMVDQLTPDGSLTYTQTGTYADGTPKYSATTKLSDANQQAKDIQDQAGIKASQIGSNQLDAVSAALSQPFNVDAAAEQKLYDLGRSRLDPRFARESDQLESDLVNRGIRPGSQAYAASRGVFDQGRNDAYNELALTGRQQAVAEALTERNQPLNEMRGLFGLDSIDQPDLVSTPKTSVAGTDLAGLVSDNYKSKVSQYNATLGGLFGLAGSGASALGRFYGAK